MDLGLMTYILMLFAVPLNDTKTSEVKKFPLVVNSRFTCKRRKRVLKIYQYKVDKEFCGYSMSKTAIDCDY
jgi:hypothetical protein